uniref:Glutathione S-transferase kappa 1 n=1 Tax=Sinocyclocheilus anshuiensis TaxID=1608454 RepID=A0A671RG44_9TELE
MFSSGKVVELFYDDVDKTVCAVLILCFKVLCRYKNARNIDLKFKPAFLTGVIYGSGNQPAVVNPSKLIYMVSDLKLASEYFGVPMFRPSKLSEKDSLNAMRFVTAVAEKGIEGDTLERVSRELWTRKWRTHQDITQPASLTDAGLKAGLSANEVEEILTLSTSQPIKDKLKSVTEETLEYKCFGFPFIVCHVNGKAKVFFGSDRFELMAHK